MGLKHCGWGAIALVVLCISATGSAADRQLQFSPPKDASLLLKNRTRLRGKLVSFDREQAVVEVTRGSGEPKQVEVKSENIASLRTIDGEFEFRGGDDVGQAIATAGRLQGASLVEVDLPGATAEPEPPPLADPASPSRPPPGEPTPSTTPESEGAPASQPAAGEPAASEPSRTDAGTGPQMTPVDARPRPELGEVMEIVICGDCQKEVQVSAKYGQKCPHCGVEWAIPVAIPKVQPRADSEQAATVGIGAGGEAAHGGRPAVDGRGHAGPAPQPGAPRQIHVPPPPVPNAGVQEEMNFANLPLWMKAALFLGSTAMLYYLFFVR